MMAKNKNHITQKDAGLKNKMPETSDLKVPLSYSKNSVILKTSAGVV